MPAELRAVRERAVVLADLRRIRSLLSWDQSTMMPPSGAAGRGDQAATLELVSHECITDPELGRLLDALDPWAAGEDPDDVDVRLVRELRREFEKAIRVPSGLAAQISRADALGEGAWQEARAAADFGRFRDALARQFDLRARYIACFEGYAHPYDVLVDDFEPGMTTAVLEPLLGELVDALVPLVAAAAGDDLPHGRVFGGPHAVAAQRRAVLDVLGGVGFDPTSWRLDVAPRFFAEGIGRGDVRITTCYDADDFASAYFGCLHEFGHGLYEAAIPERLARSPLGIPNSLGLHESQSRMWENVVGRSRPFCAWALPRLAGSLPGLDDLTVDAFHRGVNVVQPSLIRGEADETTYNLHVALRFELELALVEGRLAVDDLPQAWNDGIHRLLGLDVPDAAVGVLQDVHWGAGLIGYFPTYAVGNLMAAQLWDALRADLTDVDAQIERGDFAPLRDWLGERVHRHGRALTAAEVLERATGRGLEAEPFLRYLRDKLTDLGRLPAP